MALQSSVKENIVFLFLVSVFFSLVAVATPVASDDATADFFINGMCKACLSNCSNPIIRREWKTLSETEQKNYINAIKCLTNKSTSPAIHSQFPGTRNRYDDFVVEHSSQTPRIHWVGFFIHWHRYFTGTFEKALREECGYTGAQPYWDSGKDLASGQNMNQWCIFSNTTGFGSNGPYVSHQGVPNPFNLSGSTGGGCVPAGPFGKGSTFRVNIAPGPNTTSTNKPTCLKRDFNPSSMAWGAQINVDKVLNQPNFTSYDFQNDPPLSANLPSVHGSGHSGVGGLFGPMGDLYTSPADPLFYMHHANLDRIYWQWQQKDPHKRLCEVGGPTIPFDYSLTQGPPVTLDFKIDLGALAPSIAVGHLLNTVGDTFCYKYELPQ